MDEILRVLDLNITYSMYLNPDDQLGNLLDDGTWTGTLGEARCFFLPFGLV